MPENEPIAVYVDEIQRQLLGGHAREHGYRPPLERLMRSFEDTQATNDPRRSEHGNPDFIFIKASNRDIILGYAEAKDITVDLNKTIKTEQLRRYAGYEKLFLTNYLDFRFFRNGEQYEVISIGKLDGDRIIFDSSAFPRLMHELQTFLALPPEKIKNGKRLALIMGGKARRIRDNVSIYLSSPEDSSDGTKELEKIFKMMKTLLVHDLTPEKFADMYAQTLVYGLFVARYNDKTPEDFSRSEARDLVPASNPFLREFFDHIVGPRFDSRLAHIVDELCEVFVASNVHTLVQKHLRLFEVENEKDPIIHFYEDFLKEYDPAERKRMGAYYTPIPVVRFIVRQVDDILKREFGIAKGLADASKVMHEIEVGQDVRHDRRYKLNTKQQKEFHRVQIFDPAVGTATFLNETIKHIYKSFEGQEGRWPAYVEQDLLPRLHGFELMMAPYTIAHLKLGMTLQETGITDLRQRLGVYLTNTLEEGIKHQQDLFSFGLAEVVSHEAEEASKIKHEKPIMVIIGNPPYSVSSNNKSEYIQNLIKDYKKDLNERKINLDDDYIKFIRFAEEMVSKNGEGAVAMITNNSYIDGVTHRQMRKHLLQSFDKIYVLDLHGNSKKKETTSNGKKDENIFDIQQGVSIILAVKTANKTGLGKIYHAELFGKRNYKFDSLNEYRIDFKEIDSPQPNYFFVPKNFELESEYDAFTKIDDIFIINNTGIQTKNDKLSIQFEKAHLRSVVQDFKTLQTKELVSKYNLKDSAGWTVERARLDIANSKVAYYRILYRPFDMRWSLVTSQAAGFIGRQRMNVTPSMLKDNIGLVTLRINGEGKEFVSLITNTMTEKGSLPRGNYSIFPLYIYHDDGARTVNFNVNILKRFTVNLQKSYEPEDILDYIYAVLHSPKYRERYKEFLKIDFPRVPVPKNDVEFSKFGVLGKQLRGLHLMTSPILNDFTTSYPKPGSDEVDKLRYEDRKVWINESQYFGNVSELAWNFYIGGYQPAQKWLKDRKGRKLTNDDIEHYQKIIKILTETEKIMKQIDEVWGE